MSPVAVHENVTDDAPPLAVAVMMQSLFVPMLVVPTVPADTLVKSFFPDPGEQACWIVIEPVSAPPPVITPGS